MRKKLSVLLIALIILLQAFTPAVFAASKNEVQSQTAYLCPSDPTSEGAGKTAENSVYLSKAADGAVQYIGITNDVARRAAEHLSQKGIQIRPLMNGLSRSDARSVEQALIEIHGLEKNGGTLINKINSIAKSNPNYATSLERGYELLQSIGYK
jgi:hypothetical protein